MLKKAAKRDGGGNLINTVVQRTLDSRLAKLFGEDPGGKTIRSYKLNPRKIVGYTARRLG
jgi:hypothetical protein